MSTILRSLPPTPLPRRRKKGRHPQRFESQRNPRSGLRSFSGLASRASRSLSGRANGCFDGDDGGGRSCISSITTDSSDSLSARTEYANDCENAELTPTGKAKQSANHDPHASDATVSGDVPPTSARSKMISKESDELDWRGIENALLSTYGTNPDPSISTFDLLDGVFKEQIMEKIDLALSRPPQDQREMAVELGMTSQQLTVQSPRDFIEMKRAAVAQAHSLLKEEYSRLSGREAQRAEVQQPDVQLGECTAVSKDCQSGEFGRFKNAVGPIDETLKPAHVILKEESTRIDVQGEGNSLAEPQRKFQSGVLNEEESAAPSVVETDTRGGGGRDCAASVLWCEEESAFDDGSIEKDERTVVTEASDATFNSNDIMGEFRDTAGEIVDEACTSVELIMRNDIVYNVFAVLGDTMDCAEKSMCVSWSSR